MHANFIKTAQLLSPDPFFNSSYIENIQCTGSILGLTLQRQIIHWHMLHRITDETEPTARPSKQLHTSSITNISLSVLKEKANKKSHEAHLGRLVRGILEDSALVNQY